jgi:hypothetical protein
VSPLGGDPGAVLGVHSQRFLGIPSSGRFFLSQLRKTLDMSKDESRIKWKIQFFDRQGENRGSFYSYAVTPKEASRNVWLRFKKDTPQWLHLFDDEYYERRVTIDDGKGMDRTISDFLAKDRKAPWADKDPERYRRSIEIQGDEEERRRKSFACPNCGDDISGTDYCPKCGYDRLNPQSDPFRSANWFERHLSKEARLIPKN